MNKNLLKNIFISFGSVFIVAALGSVFVFLGMNWFNDLIKPSQWIPNFFIPIVWTIIYTIASVVIFRWIAGDKIPKSVAILFVINGLLNILWCLLFFQLRLTFVGLISIILNLVFGIYLLLEIKKYNNKYFYFLSLYPIWLSIATCLNLALWILN